MSTITEIYNRAHNILKLVAILPNVSFKKVKQTVIITNKKGKYEFDDKLQRNHSKSQKSRYSTFPQEQCFT